MPAGIRFGASVITADQKRASIQLPIRQEESMANNLHISYDLHGTDREYGPVMDKIKELGNWAKIEFSFFYVNSSYSAEDAASHVWSVMRPSDRLYVVDATNNQAYWYGLGDEASEQIKNNWFS
jgi:hypothetical protein